MNDELAAFNEFIVLLKVRKVSCLSRAPEKENVLNIFFQRTLNQSTKFLTLFSLKRGLNNRLLMNDVECVTFAYSRSSRSCVSPDVFSF